MSCPRGGGASAVATLLVRRLEGVTNPLRDAACDVRDRIGTNKPYVEYLARTKR